MQDASTVGFALSLYDATMSQAAHIDDIRVNISLLIMTATAGAVPTILAIPRPQLRIISCVVLLVFGTGLTAMSMHYNRAYRHQLELADKFLQIGFKSEKQTQKLDYEWIRRKETDVWKEETFFWKDALGTSWFYPTALAGFGVPCGLIVCLLFFHTNRRPKYEA